MPYANIQLTSKGVTCEEKKRWIAGVTKQLTEAFGKNPKLIHVVIQEVSTRRPGVNGIQVAEIRRQEES
jgi:4-oxalocrotonate tautomerase family enzyme